MSARLLPGTFIPSLAIENMTAADAILRQCYGDEVADQFFKLANNTAFIEGTREASPMAEWIASRSLGTIKHHQWGAARVERACHGPVRVVSLGYDAPGSEQAKAVATARYGSRLNLLTIGYINGNKHVEHVIRDIASSPVLQENVVSARGKNRARHGAGAFAACRFAGDQSPDFRRGR
jgi:hypothetical protein